MRNRKLFNKYSQGKHWEDRGTNYAYIFAQFLKQRLNLSGPQSNVIVIDLGCGHGKDVIRFHKLNVPALGFDKDVDVVSFAKKKYTTHSHNFFVYDIQRLPYQNDTRQAYFCINVIHYTDSKKVLSEIYRTLVPGGFAFIHFNLLIVDQNYTIDYHQKKSDVYELVKDFEIVEEKVFLREDALPTPHTHHIMQVIIKKN